MEYREYGVERQYLAEQLTPRNAAVEKWTRLLRRFRRADQEKQDILLLRVESVDRSVAPGSVSHCPNGMCSTRDLPILRQLHQRQRATTPRFGRQFQPSRNGKS